MAHPDRPLKFLHDNSLSLVLGALFLLFLAGLFVTGFHEQNEELAAHAEPAISMGEYVHSGAFG